MNVQELIVRMVQGVKLVDRYGSRGGFKGTFLGSLKISARTFGSARRQGLIRPVKDTFTIYKLTPEAAVEAERCLVHARPPSYSRSRSRRRARYA